MDTYTCYHIEHGDDTHTNLASALISKDDKNPREKFIQYLIDNKDTIPTLKKVMKNWIDHILTDEGYSEDSIFNRMTNEKIESFTVNDITVEIFEEMMRYYIEWYSDERLGISVMEGKPVTLI